MLHNTAKKDDFSRIFRKRDQALELAGCARMDGDTADELRWMEEVKRLERIIGDLLRGENGEG